MSSPFSSSNPWDEIGIPRVFVSGSKGEAIKVALEKALALYGDPICGTTRATFALPCNTKVLKIPYTLSGIKQNRYEATHKDCNSDIPLAECRLISEEDDVPILEMERVTPLDPGSPHLPEWSWSVDSNQIGYTHDGRLVAYDL